MHWIDYKVSVLTYKTLNTSVSQYLSQRINRRINARTLRSSATPLLIQPFARTGFKKRSFRCAAPSVWNSLPASVIGSDSLSVFKSRLKTFLFCRYFFGYTNVLVIIIIIEPWVMKSCIHLCVRRHGQICKGYLSDIVAYILSCVSRSWQWLNEATRLSWSWVGKLNFLSIVCVGAFGRQQKMRDMGVDKLLQSLLLCSDPNVTEVYVYIYMLCFFPLSFANCFL